MLALVSGDRKDDSHGDFAKGIANAFRAASEVFAFQRHLTQTGPNLGLPSGSFFPDAPFGNGGDLGRNHFRGPEINNWDLVLQKATQITERMGLEFRMEVYSLFNRVQFGQPENLTSDPGVFGQSTRQVRRGDETSGARQIQFGLEASVLGSF